MFLVEDRRPGLHNFVFTHTDPRQDGYKGNVIEDVRLDYDMNAIHLWPYGEPMPEPQLGQDPADPKRYKVFKSPDELKSAGYTLIYPGAPFVFPSWSQYARMLPEPAELAEKLNSDEWFEYLDEIDEATKLRRQRDVEPEPPEGSDLDRIAEWIAKQRLAVDGGTRQILYLPTGALPDEIRLIEVNERAMGDVDQIEPFTFRNEIAGRQIDVSVADITGEQLDAIKRDPSKLPEGWSFDGVRVFDGWRTRRLAV